MAEAFTSLGAAHIIDAANTKVMPKVLTDDVLVPDALGNHVATIDHHSFGNESRSSIEKRRHGQLVADLVGPGTGSIARDTQECIVSRSFRAIEVNTVDG